MMLELVQVIVLAVLCSSTQGRLVQVSVNEATCSDIVFWCTSELGVLNWAISTTTTVPLHFSIKNGTVRLNLMLVSSLVEAQVTFSNGSFINATVTIMRPINLNGSMIECNGDILTPNIPANTGRLVQVSNEATCSDEVVFWCTKELGFLHWEIRTRTGSTFSFSTINSTVTLNNTLDSSLVAQVTFNNGSFINATVTIMRPINLNGSMIDCNRDTLTLNIPANTGLLPTSLNISQIEPGNMLDIHWSSEGNDYCIQSSVNGSWIYTVNASYTIPLENETYELTIALHPVMNMVSNFTIGTCLFHDNHIMERNYTLELNGTWTVFQECNNSRIQFNARCGSSGSWTTDMSSSTMCDITSTQGTNHMSVSTKPVNEDQLLILISSLITSGVLIILAVIAAIICFKLRGKRKKKKSREYPAQAEFSEMTYQQLSNKHFHHKPNTSGRQISSVETEMCDQGEYSSLHHKKPFLPSNDEYATVTNTHQPETAKRDFLEYGSLEAKNTTSIPETSCSTSHPAHTKTKKLQYTDVDTSGHNDPMGCDLFHIKVDYADINLRARPEDKTLNLDSLLIQLNPMSKDFRLFGSVAGISPDTLDKIVASCAAPYDGLVEVCDAWLDKCRKEKTTPTWSAVADILSLIGQDKLSHDIMQVYTTGKLPIEVDTNALDVQGEVRLPSPPPIPPHRGEDNEDTGAEVELMTVTSVMTRRQLPASRDTAMEEPPPIPEKLHDIISAEVNEEPHQALPELPPKLPEKEQQRKPVPAKKKQNIDEVIPSLPPRPKNTK